MEHIKQLLLDQIHKILDDKEETAKEEIRSVKESLENENKCTVGDKHETGRARLQAELDKNSIQLIKIERQIVKLSAIDLHKEYNKAEFGSLVMTSLGNYFISLAIGKISVEGEDYYCISLASPIGKLLFQKKPGDTCIFQGKEVQIINIF
jgi:transcription elongation GreA/GreB family factor